MEEGRVTVDGKTIKIPEPFMVIATQNPSGFVGTYPLPEAQLDRFALKLTMGYPALDEEIAIVSSRETKNPIDSIKPVANVQLVRFLSALAASVRIDEALVRYIVTLVSATRAHRMISLGASPRASLALKRLAQCYAFMHSREYVIPEDIADLFVPAVSHRLTLRQEAKLGGVDAEAVAREILRSTQAPFKGKSV